MLAFGAAGCASGSSNDSETSQAIVDSGDTTRRDPAPQSTPVTGDPEPDTPADTPADPTLSDEETAGLLWMREEEQLAHDVYTALSDRWGLRIFGNITASESTHIEAALQVLDRYDIADPAAGNETGEFTDPRIQTLYDQLVERGTASAEDALEVGAFIEELDIDDLRIHSAATDVAALTDLYAKLGKGSRNHLRAFTSQLAARGVAYEPSRLDRNTYVEIVSSPMERGHDV